MNGLDYAVIGVIGLSALFAFARGFVREALSIVAWAGAALITLYGFHDVYSLVARRLHTPLLAELVAGAGLFLASLIVLTIATSLLARFLSPATLSPIDRTLGLVFGLARGAILVSAAFLLLDMSVPPKDQPVWVKQAKSAPLLQEGANALRTLLPASFRMNEPSVLDARRRAAARAKQARAAMDALVQATAPLPPKKKKGAGKAPAPEYPPIERQELNRLVGNHAN